MACLVLCGACHSSSSIPGGGLDASVDVGSSEALCGLDEVFPVPSELQCGSAGVSQAWAVDMVCRGTGQFYFYVPRHEAHSASCSVSVRGSAVFAETSSEWCRELPRPSNPGSLWPCAFEDVGAREVDLSDDITLFVDGNPLTSPVDSCVTGLRDYGPGCPTREDAIIDVPFVADEVCTLNANCASASIRVSGPQIDVEASERTSAMLCDSVRYRDGRLEVQATPWRRNCFNTTSNEPTERIRVVDCPLPPSVPRRAVEVFVNGRFVDTIDLGSGATCDEL